MSNFLNQPKIEKYSVWFTTGKIFPEAGQISPELTHFGPSKTIY
ncbi:C protein [Yersinia enterocolitica]|nr:C protein [Yersinia enterocolitica]